MGRRVRRPAIWPATPQAALAALDARGIERATIVGHSLGGAVAAWLAAHHPERVAALVLAAPAANVASLEWMDRWLTLPVAGTLTSAASLTGTRPGAVGGPAAPADRAHLERSTRTTCATPVAHCSAAHVRRAFDAEQRALMP